MDVTNSATLKESRFMSRLFFLAIACAFASVSCAAPATDPIARNAVEAGRAADEHQELIAGGIDCAGVRTLLTAAAAAGGTHRAASEGASRPESSATDVLTQLLGVERSTKTRGSPWQPEADVQPRIRDLGARVDSMRACLARA
jgi:hypothetical protein